MCKDFDYVEDIKKNEKVANTISSLWTMGEATAIGFV